MRSGSKCCKIVIDSGNTGNTVAVEMVENLG